MINVLINFIDSINNSTFFSCFFAAVIIVAFILFIRYIINILHDIRSYLVEKTYTIELKNNMIKSGGNNNKNGNIEFTNSVLDLVAFMINAEIVSQLKEVLALNQPYVVANLDNDIKKISEAVVNGVNIKLFDNPELALTKEYLMTYIIKQTTMSMIEVTVNHNNNIRTVNRTAE